MQLPLGLAAWSNAHFDHILYPLRTPHAERLARYASVFPIVEADSLHHQMPDQGTLRAWVDQTPDGFRFLPKMHKDATHAAPRQRGRRVVALETVRAPPGVVRAYMERLTPLVAARRCGPVLVQYAKDFTWGDANMKRLAQTLALVDQPAAVELRHASWWNDATRSLLEDHGAALVWSTFDKAQVPAWATAPFGYVRFAGTTGKTRDRWVAKRDRLEDVLEIRSRLRAAQEAGHWKECFVVVTNRFEGNAVDSIPRIAAALGEHEMARRLERAPGRVLFPDTP